jgi:thioredoxin-like negative regulator of GroEL
MVQRPLPWNYLLVLGILLAAAHSGSAQEPAKGASEVKWRTDYTSARKESHEKGLPLVIDFGTTNCFWCKKLDESTFRDPRVIATMNEKVIPLKIDAEREVQLREMLRVSVYPTIVVASPEGRILNTMEGFQETSVFQDKIGRALAMLTPPDWMQRDLDIAQKAIHNGDMPRATVLLKAILEDGKTRPVQLQANKLIQELETKAADRIALAKQQHAKGQSAEALENLTETLRLFPTLAAAKDATDLIAKVAQNPEVRAEHRNKRAKELIVQAKDFYKTRDFIPCLDRCELLVGRYGDLAEGQEASVLIAEIKNNPEWLQGAADTMTDRLGGVYLALADSLLKRGQVARAEFYLQRVVQSFPGSRQAESAQIRLTQLQGSQGRRPEIQVTGDGR